MHLVFKGTSRFSFTSIQVYFTLLDNQCNKSQKIANGSSQGWGHWWFYPVKTVLCLEFPSVLWNYCLQDRKTIWSVKKTGSSYSQWFSFGDTAQLRVTLEKKVWLNNNCSVILRQKNSNSILCSQHMKTLTIKNSYNNVAQLQSFYLLNTAVIQEKCQ